jgi:peptidoglycan/xylan/chitin deacetylase (PgdA/CDA1 family)
LDFVNLALRHCLLIYDQLAMSSFFDFARRGVTVLASEIVGFRNVVMRNKRAVISFSFDDFPRSAVINGARILEKYGVRGTFYAAGSMCKKVEDGMVYFGPSDLATLTVTGHEIGCHTFSHVSVSKVAAKELDSEIARNASFITENLPGLVMRSFAYPYGDISLCSTRALLRKFDSCRSTRYGLNIGRVDLGLLKAVRLYDPLIDNTGISALIDKAIANNAWLIFYTHDVDEFRRQFGSTTTLFEGAVRASAASQADVLTIRDAVNVILHGDK